MLRHARAILFIALVFPLNALAQNTATAPVRKARASKAASRYNKRLQTISFQSKLVGQTLPYIVVLPVDYDEPAARSKRYPVLYLLHGLAGHYDNWTTRTKLSV